MGFRMLKLRTIGISDYSVLEGRQRIGRIRLAEERLPPGWLWSITGYLTGGLPAGFAEDRGTAMAQFRVRSSRARRSPVCLPATASPSAWMEKGPGGTTCSLSGCGVASNTRRSICEPMKASARPVARSADITTAPRIKPTSIYLRSARRPNPGRGSTYRRGILFRQPGPVHNETMKIAIDLRN